MPKIANKNDTTGRKGLVYYTSYLADPSIPGGYKVDLYHNSLRERIWMYGGTRTRIRADRIDNLHVFWNTVGSFLSRVYGYNDFMSDINVGSDAVIPVCAYCDSVYSLSQGKVTHNNQFVCNGCYVNRYFVSCPSCNKATSSIYALSEVGDVCGSCIQAVNARNCNQCNMYFPSSAKHDYNHKCMCTYDAHDFTVAHSGHEHLDSDVRTTVSMPGGQISAEGLKAIYAIINTYHGKSAVTVAKTLGNEWQTKDGNWTKRLSRTLYNNDKTKIDKYALSRIGGIAQEHSKGVDFSIEFTRNLNLAATAFAHRDSCWWTSYSDSRCTLKSNGGFGMRSFAANGKVSGRAWVMPLKTIKVPKKKLPKPSPMYKIEDHACYTCRRNSDRVGCCRKTNGEWNRFIISDHEAHVKNYNKRMKAYEESLRGGTEDKLVPTFDTTSPTAFIVFNGYKDLQGYAACRILAQMTGMTYRKVEFYVDGIMYINGESGYLVAPEELAEKYTDGRLSLDNLSIHSDLLATEAPPVPEVIVDELAQFKEKIEMKTTNTFIGSLVDINYVPDNWEERNEESFPRLYTSNSTFWYTTGTVSTGIQTVGN